MKFKQLTGQTQMFANHCFKNKTVEELRESMDSLRADPNELFTWSLEEDQWRNAIRAALIGLYSVKKQKEESELAQAIKKRSGTPYSGLIVAIVR